MRISDVFLPFKNTPNHNGRIYNKACVEEAFNKYKENVNNQTLFGEAILYDSETYSGIVDINNVTHVIEKLEITDKGIEGTIKLLDTPRGKLIKNYINSGIKLCIRPRMIGKVDFDTKLVDVEEFIAFDFIEALDDTFNDDSYRNRRIKLKKDE